jgi:hypothetical protein
MKYAITLLLLFPLLLAAQQRLHVNHAANGQQTGLSWTDAFPRLEQALALAQPGDEVWVAKGLYVPDTAAWRNATFAPRSGVRLLGGFAGTESVAEDRDPVQHHTILSGNVGNKADSTDNVFTVLYLAYPDSNTYISGFTIEHGYAVSDTSFGNVSPFRAGAGVYIFANDSTAYPLFDRCTIRHNVALGNGGGVMVRGRFTKGCAPRFQYCRLFNNKCGNNGGAIWYEGGSNTDRGTRFYACDFDSNTAVNAPGTNAGAVYYRQLLGQDTLSFKKCRFVNNQSRSIAGAIQLEGGSNKKMITLDSCFISKNKTLGIPSGSAASDFICLSMIGDTPTYAYVRFNTCEFNDQEYDSNNIYRYLIYGNLFVNNSSSLIFSKNIFKKCSGNIYAGEYPSICVDSNIMIESNFMDLLWYGNKNKITNNVFIDSKFYMFIGRHNTTSFVNFSNNLMFSSNPPGGNQENGITMISFDHLYKDTAYFLTNIFCNFNYRQPNTWNYPDSAQLKIYAHNNIFLNNRDAVTGALRLPFRHEPFDLDFDHNITDVDCAAFGGNVNCGTHNITVSEWPFVDTAALNFRLKSCTPGINGGTDQFLNLLNINRDLAGNPRIQGTAPDIGPYEHEPQLLAAQFVATPSCANGASGSAVPQVSGGCPPYSFVWSGTNSGGSGPLLTNLAPGTYAVTVLDERKHQLVTQLVIPALDTLLLPEPFVENTPAGQNNGLISVVPEGGAAPYTAQWNTGQTTLEIDSLAAGAYTVTVTDANGCTATGSYLVGTVSTQEAATTLHFSIQPNPARSLVYILGVTPVRVALYNTWGLLVQEHRESVTTLDLSTLQTGTYLVRITDKNGRQGTQRVVVR